MAVRIYTKECRWCGQTFETTLALKSFCSPACVDKHKKLIAKEKELASNELTGEVRTCLQCGGQFWAKVGEGWHCSAECCAKTMALHKKLCVKRNGVS